MPYDRAMVWRNAACILCLLANLVSMPWRWPFGLAIPLLCLQDLGEAGEDINGVGRGFVSMEALTLPCFEAEETPFPQPMWGDDDPLAPSVSSLSSSPAQSIVAHLASNSKTLQPFSEQVSGRHLMFNTRDGILYKEADPKEVSQIYLGISGLRGISRFRDSVPHDPKPTSFGDLGFRL